MSMSSKMPLLTDLQWSIEVGIQHAHMNLREISKQLGCSQATWLKLRRHFEHMGSLSDSPRPGRPRVTTAST